MEKPEWTFRTTQYFLSSHCVLGCILSSGIQPSTHRQMVPAFMELRFCKQRQLMNKSTNNYFFHSSKGCGEKEGRVRGSRIVWVVRKELSAEDSVSRGLTRGKGGPWEDGRRASMKGGHTSFSCSSASWSPSSDLCPNVFLPPSLSLLPTLPPTLYLLCSSSCHSCVHAVFFFFYLNS